MFCIACPANRYPRTSTPNIKIKWIRHFETKFPCLFAFLFVCLLGWLVGWFAFLFVCFPPPLLRLFDKTCFEKIKTHRGLATNVFFHQTRQADVQIFEKFSPHQALSSHLPLNREGRWGTTDDFATSILHFVPVLHCPLGLGELQACPFPDVVFPPLPLSALSSSPFHCGLHDGFSQTW